MESKTAPATDGVAVSYLLARINACDQINDDNAFAWLLIDVEEIGIYAPATARAVLEYLQSEQPLRGVGAVVADLIEELLVSGRDKELEVIMSMDLDSSARAVRAWAAGANVEVSSRGRIPGALRRSFEEALRHQAEAPLAERSVALDVNAVARGTAYGPRVVDGLS